MIETALSIAMGCVALAMLLNQPLKGVTLFRTIFYMPAVVGGVATIMMWIWIWLAEIPVLSFKTDQKNNCFSASLEA